MSSAPIGTRMVARALPGGAGCAARARASAACLAAWRAAQGAAPRRPSLRLRGEPPEPERPSSRMTASVGGVTASAVGRARERLPDPPRVLEGLDLTLALVLVVLAAAAFGFA